MDNHPLFSPTNESIQQTKIKELMDRFNYHNYHDLHEWSCTDPEEFWSTIWDLCEIIGDKSLPIMHQFEPLKPEDTPYRFEETRFFVNAKLNFAENLLKKRDTSNALVFLNEHGKQYSLTHEDLYNQVSQMVQFLNDCKIEKGDRVAGFTPNIPEAVVMMLACACVGAIWTACSPDFGVQSVCDRFGQTSPKILLTAEGYLYNGKKISLQQKIPEILEKVESIQYVVVASEEDEIHWDQKLFEDTRYHRYHHLLKKYKPCDITFQRFEFNIPLFILYSSGTTGIPKCIVHGAGGTLITHLKEHQLHCDIRPNDRVFFYTSCGWMMWNWLVSALSSNACLILYDGSPFFPKIDILLDYIEQESITFFGGSAKYLSLLLKNNIIPHQNLKSLRTIASTGSPLAPELYDYIYDHFKKDLHLMSISGGTDILSCFLIGNPVSPLYRGEIQGAGLGYHIQVFKDEQTDNLSPAQCDIGEAGELVCVKPFPSQPLFFWKDYDLETKTISKPSLHYHNAYFSRFTNVWHHGDRIEQTKNKGFIIHGRSDAVLNPGGVRIGTAEIYRQVEQIPQVLESLAVGQEWQDDIRIILFVILKIPHYLDDDLIHHIKSHIRLQTTARHVPHFIFQVQDLPRTKNGKLAEIAVRDLVNSVENTNLSSLSNPQSLDELKKILPHLHQH